MGADAMKINFLLMKSQAQYYIAYSLRSLSLALAPIKKFNQKGGSRLPGFAILFALVALSGCVSTVTQSGLSFALQADPDSIFSKSETNLYVDIANKDSKDYRNVERDV